MRVISPNSYDPLNITTTLSEAYRRINNFRGSHLMYLPALHGNLVTSKMKIFIREPFLYFPEQIADQFVCDVVCWIHRT